MDKSVYMILAGHLYEGYDILGIYEDFEAALTHYQDLLGGYDWKTLEKVEINKANPETELLRKSGSVGE